MIILIRLENRKLIWTSWRFKPERYKEIYVTLKIDLYSRVNTKTCNTDWSFNDKDLDFSLLSTARFVEILSDL